MLSYYWCLRNKHSSRWCWCFQCPDPAPLIWKLAERCPTAANNNEFLFHRPIAITLRMSVNMDILFLGRNLTLFNPVVTSYAFILVFDTLSDSFRIWLLCLLNICIVCTIVHYEYMALAIKTSVLREAMLLLFESAWSAVNKSKVVSRRVADIFWSHVQQLCFRLSFRNALYIHRDF